MDQLNGKLNSREKYDGFVMVMHMNMMKAYNNETASLTWLKDTGDIFYVPLI